VKKIEKWNRLTKSCGGTTTRTQTQSFRQARLTRLAAIGFKSEACGRTAQRRRDEKISSDQQGAIALLIGSGHCSGVNALGLPG
jgi:hypothetical protein